MSVLDTDDALRLALLAVALDRCAAARNASAYLSVGSDAVDELERVLAAEVTEIREAREAERERREACERAEAEGGES